MTYLVVVTAIAFALMVAQALQARVHGKLSTAVDDGGVFSRAQACNCTSIQGPSQWL